MLIPKAEAEKLKDDFYAGVDAIESGFAAIEGVVAKVIDALADDEPLPPPEPPTILHFRFDPMTVEKGQPTKLQWSVFGASRVMLSPTIEAEQHTGELVVRPDVSTTWELRAYYSETQYVPAYAEIAVTEPPPPPTDDPFTVSAVLVDSDPLQTGLEFTSSAGSGQIRVEATSPHGDVNMTAEVPDGMGWLIESKRLYVNFGFRLPDGRHEFLVRLEDVDGHKATRTLVLTKGEAWENVAYEKSNRVWVSPRVDGRPWDWASWGFVHQSVAGTVTLGLKIAKTGGPDELGDNLNVQWWKDGEKWGGVQSGYLTKDFWDTTRETNASHEVRVELIDAPKKYRALPAEFRVANGPALTTPHKVPAIEVQAIAFFDPQNSTRISAASQFVQFPGTRTRRPNSHPYPAKVAPLPTTDAERQAMANPSAWVIEPTSLRDTWGHTIPCWFQDDKGVTYYGQHFGRAGINTEDSIGLVSKFPQWCGPRNDCNVSEYSTFAGVPDGSWIGISITGRMFHRRKNGSVRTICGYAIEPKSTVVPMDPRNANIKPEQVRAHQEVMVAGDFSGYEPGYFKSPNDLCIDNANPNVVYVADTENHRIAKVTFEPGWNRPVVTTHVDLGSYEPYSLTQLADGTICYVDRDQGRVREVGFGTLAVIPGAQWIRRTSKNNLIVTCTIKPSVPKGKIFRVNRQGDVKLLLETGYITAPSGQYDTWVGGDVDRWGSIGPVDAVYVASSLPGSDEHGMTGERSSILRILLDGNDDVISAGPFLAECNGGPYTFGAPGDHNIMDPFGHYPWGSAVHPTESRFICTGYGSSGTVEWRRRLPGDPVDHPEDLPWFRRGQAIHFTGTIPGQPLDSWPAFATLHGAFLTNYAGNVRNADDLASLGRDALIAEIQKGLDSGVPRPEIVGDDARAYAYFIEKISMYGWLKDVRP